MNRTETLYQLLKNYENPSFKTYSGVIKPEHLWLKIFPSLNKGDCKIKTDWFKPVVDFKIVSFEKDGIIYERCKECPDSSEKFVSTTAHHKNSDGFIKSSFNGIDWALNNGYIPRTVFYDGRVFTPPQMEEKDLKHLEWVYLRMKHVHNENENVDYMIRFKEILDNINNK